MPSFWSAATADRWRRARSPPCRTASTSAIAIISRPSSSAMPGPMSAICARRGCPASPADFFDLSQRLESPDGTFNGVIAVAVRPSYFEDFYGLIGQTPGSFFALVRADGAYLARYPVPGDRLRRLSPASRLRTAIGRWPRPRPVHGRLRDRRRLPARRLSQTRRASRSTRSPAPPAPRSRRNGSRHVRAVLIFGVPATLAGPRPCSGSRCGAPGGSTRKPTAARWRKVRCGRRNGSKRSAN